MKEQIEEMRNEQIVEMAKALMNAINEKQGHTSMRALAEALYNAGYRKQKEGEWKRIEVNGENYGQIYYQHKDCKVNETQIFPSPYHFCPNCGAHIRGGKNE